MEMVEQLAVKLLARCSRETADMMAECLCREPDKAVIANMLKEVRSMLDEFEEAYFDSSR
jgi:hypothetical protein